MLALIGQQAAADPLWLEFLPTLVAAPLTFLAMRARRRAREAQDIAEVMRSMMEVQHTQIEQLTQQILATPAALTAVQAAGEYIQRWQESQPMTPEAVAGVCAMVIDHLHLTIKDLNDENVATMILTCCEVLDQMRAVAEDDQDTIDAAREAWKAQFE